MRHYNFPMTIRTKILATIGPATASRKMLHQIFEAGCDAIRINFSHGSDEQREAFLSNIRAVERERGVPVAVCGDLCGPKIRVGLIRGGGVLLGQGQMLVIQRKPIEGDTTRISTTLEELVDDVSPGEEILLDDGKLRLAVVETHPPDEILCRVVVGGVLGSGKGVNLPNTPLRLSALTEKDRRDVAWIARHDFDYVALSFVQRAEDIHLLRDLLRQHRCDARIIAKIEKPRALENLDEILQATDAVMVARGDLGVEMDFPSVPVAQKRIARRARQMGKPCIIATQMLESMISSPTPTRAEVSDVANAVLDHADAVMLSGETSVGKYPVAAVEAMNRTVHAIQSYDDEIPCCSCVESEAFPTMAAVARAVRTILEVEKIAAVAVFTTTGDAACLLAKNRPACPILALTCDVRTARRTCLYYGVQAAVLPEGTVPEHTRDVLALASRLVRQRDLAKVGDRIVVVSGRPLLGPDRANSIVVHTVEAEN